LCSRFVFVIEKSRTIGLWSGLQWWECRDADLLYAVLDSDMPVECLLDRLLERYDDPVLREVAEAFQIPVG
jgi:hypothetical protein